VRTPLDRRFIVVSGLPGSGKSWLALKLAHLLGLAVIDKDDILERLFDSKGTGDLAWRRTLSRQSDLIFRQDAEASNGAILVSFWRLPGMPADSGTPTDWLMGLSNRIVNLHCVCPVEVAAARFSRRRRHPGHLDSARSCEQILTSIRELAQLKPMEIGERVSVDTSAEIELQSVVSRISSAFERAYGVGG
jgi:AAA domain